MASRFLIVCGGSGINLLGQRRVLGFDAELQVDVREESVGRKRLVKDEASFVLELDKSVGTTAALFESLSDLVDVVPREGLSEYLQEAIYAPEDRNHLDFLRKHYPQAANLQYGLAQSPAVGKAAIRHPANVERLRQIIHQMISTYAREVGSENPIEVWIVSSTAGGTGEGTHRYVAVELAHYIKTNYQRTPLQLNFIRVGQGTYNSVGRVQTALNTFFGIAADSALTLKARDDFPFATLNWFYVDLPDVGIGDRAKAVRAEMVEMAAKAIMLEELQEDLNKLLVNNGGAPIVVARTGFWGRDFDDNLKYYETLRQLVAKLRQLVEPDYKRTFIQDHEQPSFSAPSLEQIRQDISSPHLLREQIEEGWAFPRYRFRSIPNDLQEVGETVQSWVRSVQELLGKSLSEIECSYWVTETVVVEGREQRQSMVLSVPASVEEGYKWFDDIWGVHRTLAWARHLLGLSWDGKEVKRDGLLARLYDQAKEISEKLYSLSARLTRGSEKRAQDVAPLLGDFLDTLLKVTHLLELERRARRLLDQELAEPREVLKVAVEELDITKSILGGGTATTTVESSDLSTVLDRLTGASWLQMLRSAVRRGDRGKFREVVLQGAVGLTAMGLRSVLGLNEQAEAAEIQNTLATSVGRMLDAEGDVYEAPWWGAQEPTATLKYEYRILPKVSRDLQAKLLRQKEVTPTSFRYVFTELGVIGLYVLAFLGVSLNTGPGDTVTAPAYLMQPFVEVVHSVLNDRWVETPIPNTPSGQLEIVRAGAGGDFLYRRALEAVGLNEEEIAKIGHFYKMVE